MCGRYTLTDPGEQLIRHFQLTGLPAEYRPRYNIAPTQPVLAVIGNGQRRAGLLRWGLVPGWAKDPSIGSRLINARAETVAEKPAFRHALRRRRCLIPADGFYEWRQQGGRKQPMRIVRRDGGLFAFAGLWESWRPPQASAPAPGRTAPSGAGGEARARANVVLYTCTIITTEANGALRSIHERMPVILPPEAYDLWLDQDVDDPAALLPLLKPRPDDELVAYPVSTLVNDVRNDSPDCIRPLQG